MIRQINVKQLAAHLADGQHVYLLDVRQPKEQATAALPDSHLMPLGELVGRTDEVQPVDDALVVV